MNQISKLLTIGLCILFLSTVNLNAQSDLSKEEIRALNQGLNLVADKATMKKELLAVDSILLAFQLDEEELFPAEDIYDGLWDTEHVKAYHALTVPDSFRIDVSSFVIPFAGRITSKYGPRRRRFHYGTDIKVEKGDTIRAAFDGKIRVKRYERRGYGYYLVLRHPNGLETVYGHLSGFLVDQEEDVKAGQPIGLGGNTGRSSGSHLHFEMRFLGQAINPEDVIDFDQFCTKDECYVFQKSKSGKVANKYVARAKSKAKSKSTTTTASKNTSKKDDGQSTYYRIKNGDTLSTIAKRHGVSVKEICRLNKITTKTTLKIGRNLRIS